jgi:hypothetical protein
MTVETIVDKGYGGVDRQRVLFRASASEENGAFSHRRRRTGEDSWASQHVWFPWVTLASNVWALQLEVRPQGRWAATTYNDNPCVPPSHDENEG